MIPISRIFSPKSLIARSIFSLQWTPDDIRTKAWYHITSHSTSLGLKMDTGFCGLLLCTRPIYECTIGLMPYDFGVQGIQYAYFQRLPCNALRSIAIITI